MKHFELAANRHVKNSNPIALEQRLNDQHYYNASGDKKVIWQGQSARVHRFDDGIDYQMYRAQACEADARAAGYAACIFKYTLSIRLFKLSGRDILQFFACHLFT